jgi:hypothetical protein
LRSPFQYRSPDLHYDETGEQLVDGFAAFGQRLVRDPFENPQAVKGSQTLHFGQGAGDSLFHGSPFGQRPGLSQDQSQNH